MKVLFILPEFEPHTKGGICTYYRELLSYNASNPHWESIVFQGSAVDARGGKINWGQIPVYYLDLNRLESYINQFSHLNIFPEFQKHVAASWAIHQQISELKIEFDVVVCVDWGLGFIPWILHEEKPVVIHLHGSAGQIDYFEPRKGLEILSQLYLNIEGSLLSKASELVTHSKQNIKFWEQRMIQGPKIKLIAPLMELNALEPTDFSDSKAGLVIGRIQYWKGIILLCEAIRMIPTNLRQMLKIYWMGRDTVYQKTGSSMIKYLANKYSDIWNKNIIPIGEMSNKEVGLKIRKVGWGLIPSVWDMFNLTGLEHIFNGNFLLCSKGAGISDFLYGHTATTIFEPTAKDLADALIAVLNMPDEKRKEAVINGRNHLNNIFDPAKVLKEHFHTFESAASKLVAQKNTIDLAWLTPKNNGTDAMESIMDLQSLKKLTTYILKRFKI